MCSFYQARDMGSDNTFDIMGSFGMMSLSVLS